MGCFVQGRKNGMGCFVRGDKNCMGCFVRGGKLMRDVLSGVAKNGMGCFVPGCFVLHSRNIHISCCSLHASCMCVVGNKCPSMFERISTFHLTNILLVTTGERAPTPSLVTTFVVC